VLGNLPYQLLAGAGQVAQLLDGRWRYKARANQSVRKQIGNPGGVTNIGLATRNVADVLGVGQHQLKVTLEQMPHRLPVHPCSFHRHVSHGVLSEPVVELQQSRGRRREAFHLVVRWLRDAADTGDNAILVYVQPGTARIQHLHRCSSVIAKTRWRREKPSSSKSNIRAPERKRSWQQFGVLARSRVQLVYGLVAPRNKPTSFPTPPRSYRKALAPDHPLFSFMPRGLAAAGQMWN
jgi:hypothetical protein